MFELERRTLFDSRFPVLQNVVSYDKTTKSTTYEPKRPETSGKSLTEVRAGSFLWKVRRLSSAEKAETEGRSRRKETERSGKAGSGR